MREGGKEGAAPELTCFRSGPLQCSPGQVPFLYEPQFPFQYTKGSGPNQSNVSADEGKADGSVHELGYGGAGPGDVREGYSGPCGQYEPLGGSRVQEEQGNGGLRVRPVCVGMGSSPRRAEFKTRTLSKIYL